MTDSSDMDVFDSITSGEGNANAPIIEHQQAEAGQQRDEGGRFANKADEPAVIEPEQPASHEQHETGRIPVGALQAEREKARTARDEAETLRREIAELRGMVTAQRQPAPQPQQEQAQPVTIWDDPDAFLKSQLSPVQQQMQEMREMMWENQAAQSHTAEKLEAAKAAAAAIMGTPAGVALHSEITAGGNPFSNLVKWHERQTTLATVGNDPTAWLNAEIERRMADPAFQAQVIERARGGVATSSPSRSQPVTNIPPSLSRIPSTSNAAADGDMSDGALFSQATSGRRG